MSNSNRFGNFDGITKSHALAQTMPMRTFDNRGDDYDIPDFGTIMAPSLAGINALMLAADGPEFPELVVPPHFWELAGAKVTVASPSWMHKYRNPAGAIAIGEWTNDDRMFITDIPFSAVNISEYDVIYWPGGAWCPDSLREDEEALRLVCQAHEQGLLVATICHGGWVLCNAARFAPQGVKSFPAANVQATGVSPVAKDLRVYGFTVPAGDVVYDQNANLLTATGPRALGQFCNMSGQLLAHRLANR